MIPTTDAGTENPAARSGDYSEAFAGIDQIDESPQPGAAAPATAQAEPPAQPTAAAPAQPKPAAPAPGDDDLEKLSGKKPEDPKPQPGAKPTKPAGKESLKEFREQYEMTKKERDELKARVDELSRAREDGTKAEIEKATKALRDEMDAIRKRADESEQELRFTNFTRSQEYKEKYQEPWGRAWKTAVEYAEGVEVEDQATGESRKATYNDILALTRLPEAQAEKVAHQRFGPNAVGMLRHRAAIIDAKQRMDSAVEEWKTKGQEREKQMAAEAEARTKVVVEHFDGTLKELETGYPTLFGKEEGDDEGNAYLEKGDALVRTAFRGDGIDPSLPDEQRMKLLVKVQAQVAARAKAFGRERLRSIRLADKVKELEAKLKAFDESEPGQGGIDSAGAGVHKSPEDAIDELTG